MSDVVERLFVMDSDRSTPQTPPLMESHPCAPAKSAPYIRHRKTSSGLWNLDMEKLMAFPVEALPLDEEVDLSHHLSDKLRVQDCMKVDVEQELNATCPLETQTTMGSDCSDGVDTLDGGSISWPPTPSCGSYPMKIGDDYYDSDQETVIEDEELSSAGSASEEDFETVQKEWDMGCTLVDDEVLEEFPFSFDFSSPFPESGSDRELPDYVGIAPDSALMSIPEDVEVCLDKIGNHVSVESTSIATAQLECIEHDAVKYLTIDNDNNNRHHHDHDHHHTSNNDDGVEEEDGEDDEEEEGVKEKKLRSQKEEEDVGLLDNVGRFSVNQTEESSKSMRRPVSHKEAVEAILVGSSTITTATTTTTTTTTSRGITQIRHRHQARHSKRPTVTDYSDLYGSNKKNDNDDDDDEKKLEVACEVVLSDMNDIVRSAEDKRFLQSVKDGKASVGCCAGLKRIPSFGKARRRIEAIGRVLKKHWPVITSAVVPIVLFFSCRSNK